jgi:MFS family permease
MLSREKKILGGLSACHAVNHLFFESLGPLLPFIIPTFNLTYTQAGRLGLVYYISYGMSSYPAGHWADRYGRKMMIFLFLLISSMATLLMGFCYSFWQLILFCGLAGVGGGLYHPSGTSLVSEVVPIARRGMALGIHGSGGSMGILLTFVLGGGTASLFGWRVALIVLSMVGFALLVWFKLAIDLRDEKIALDQSETFALPTTSGFFPLVRAVLIFFIIYGMVMVIFKGAYTWIPTYLKETFHISAGKAIIFSIILPFVGISSNILMGKFSDQYGRKRSLFIVFLILSLCLFFLFLGNRLFLIPLLIILGFFLNCFAPLTNAYTADLIPPELRGKAFGLIFAFSICLSGFSPYIMGIISDRTSLSGGILFLSGASLIAGFVSMVGPEKRRKI